MQLVIGAKFLNITFPLALFGAAAVADAIVVVLLTRIYVSLLSHKLHLNIKVLNLICLSLLHVPRDSSFVLTLIFCPLLSCLDWCIV